MNLKTLYKISYGMYIVSSKKGEKLNGQIANTVFQITAEPPTIAVSINKQNLTHEFIEKSKVFVVSVLSQETPIKFIGQFGFKSGRDIDKFKDIKHKAGTTGVPIVLENSIGYLEAEVINSIDVGTHTVFIGKIVDAEIIKEGEPMTYAYYHKVKKGTSPRTAPTYIKPEETEGGKKMTEKLQVYKCEICGNIVEVLHAGKGQLVCCGQPMKLLEDKTKEQGMEKHLPVVEKIDKGIKVKVGSVLHPMEEKHYIEWIEVTIKNSVVKKFLKPGETPEAEFEIDGDILQMRAYCNIHGLWTTENKRR